MKIFPVIVVGAGPAGIGVAVLLEKCGIPTLILERGRIGESFFKWPEETRFISPSFTGNFFGAVDLNAITPESSPAYGLQTEHPTGREYAQYLADVANLHDLKIKNGVHIEDVLSQQDNITLLTNQGDVRCRALIWAGGEAQYPKFIPDTVRVGAAYESFPKGHHVIIGGAESGMDAAYHLVKGGCTVTIIDQNAPWDLRVSDSSCGLSPYTFDRVRYLEKSGKAEFIAETAHNITKTRLQTQSRVFNLEHPAIDSTGYDVQQSLAGKLFNFVNSTPHLTDRDESTKYQNVYLVGPNVKHDDAIFCFIYKYRQRFAVVVSEILARWGKQSPVIAEYADKGFLLDDLSCCAEECAC